MREVKDLIKDKKIDLKRLEKFGFKLINKSYCYHTSLLKNQFKMSVKISLDNSIFTEIIDTETTEPYILHLLEIKRSGYSEKVHKAYSEVLEKINMEMNWNFYGKNLLKMQLFVENLVINGMQ